MADENVLTLWSQTSDFSAAVADYPGVIQKAVFEALGGGASDFYGTNGTYLLTATGATLTINGSDWDITVTSTAGLVAGMCVYVIPDDAVNNDEGYYIISSFPDGTTVRLNATGALDDVGVLTLTDTIDFFIGGVSDALDGGVPLQAELDLIGPNCGAELSNAINNLNILGYSSTAIPTTIQIDFDNISGSASTDVVYTATNSDFIEDGTRQVITLTAAGTENAVIDVLAKYITLRHIKCIGSGGTLPTHALDVSGGGEFTTLYDCHGVGAAAIGILIAGNSSRAILCFGAEANQKCISVTGAFSSISHCITIDGQVGISASSQGLAVTNCIAIGATVDAFETTQRVPLTNCIAWNCLNGFDIGGNKPSPVTNCSFNLTTGDAFVGSAGNTYQSFNNHYVTSGDLTDGNVSAVTDVDTITGDPKFNLIVELTDMASTTGTNIVTSVTGGFTAAMVGKDLIICSGTNFVGGAYRITGHTDTNEITLAEDPTNGSNASSGIGGFFDFRLQTDSPLRGAGAGAYNNIGIYSDTDTPEIASILPPDTFNDVVGTGSGGAGGGVMPLSGLLG